MPGTKRKGKGDAWYFEVTIGTDFSGKPVRYNRTFHGTEKQAEKALAKFYTECDSGKVSKESRLTIQELCTMYQKEYAERFLKKSTAKGIDSCISAWIIPCLGKRRLSNLTKLDVQKFVNAMADRGLSAKTIHNYFSALSDIINFVLKMDLIPHNPCQNISLPKTRKKESKYYDAEETQTLLNALNAVSDGDLKYRISILILLFGGLRKSELMGLNWNDINMETGEANIHITRHAAKGGGTYEDSTKTENSHRIIVLPNEIIGLLHRLKGQQLEQERLLGNKYSHSDAMLKDESGSPLPPQSVYRWFVKFTESAGLRNIGLHGLSHTHASMLAYMGVDKMQVSKRLGHSQISTTLNIYTHLFENNDKLIADELSTKYLNRK